jgi:putative transposase
MNQPPEEHKLLDFDTQIRQALLNVVQAHIPLALHAHNLTAEQLWDLLGHAATQRSTLEATCQTLAGVPAARTVRDHLAMAFPNTAEGIANLERQLNAALHAQLPAAVQRRLQTKLWEGAGDWVALPYHGTDASENVLVRGGQAKSGTSQFYTYATLAVLHKGLRVTVAITVVRAGESVQESVKRLLEEAGRLGVRWRNVYWDKGFCTIEVLQYLRAHKLSYIIPIPQRGKGGIKKLFVERRSRRARYTFQRQKKGERAVRYETAVVVVCKYSCGKYKKPGVRYFAYAVSGQEHLPVLRVFEAYRKRFSIESGYRQMHQVQAWTTSRNGTDRLLLVGLAVLLVNLYVLLRVSVGVVRCYGQRVRAAALTLVVLAAHLAENLRQRYGLQKLYILRKGWLT